MMELRLIISIVIAIALLIGLIVRWRVTPFIALILASIVVVLGAGMTPAIAIKEFSGGVGSILGATAIVIGFGAIIGAFLAESGGATAIGAWLIHVLGSNRVVWAMFLAGVLVGLGTWFTVGLVLLAPVLWSVIARDPKRIGLPVIMSTMAALSAMHGLVPPHPGPLAAIDLLQADNGKTIFWGIVIGCGSGVLVGPLGYWYWKRIPFESSRMETQASVNHNATIPPTDHHEPTLALDLGLILSALACILVPVLCMLMATLVRIYQWEASWLKTTIEGIGEPVVAMLLGTLLAYALLGYSKGQSREDLLRITEKSLGPVANVLLIVGAGAGFSRILIAAGAAEMMTGVTKQWELSPLLIGWIAAALIRVATGSATTAITTATGVLSGMLIDHPDLHVELLVIAMGAGSLTCSHVNDGGFWFVKEYFGLTVPQTLRTWTVLETAFSIVALIGVLLIDRVL